MSISIRSCIFYILTILVAVILLGDGVKCQKTKKGSTSRYKDVASQTFADSNYGQISTADISDIARSTPPKHQIQATMEVIF
ncbi:hypothetical protein M8J75_010462 [Diaphorina citri]|nr:hypothetical protein M8J75_010462 [Diaphorina citri]